MVRRWRAATPLLRRTLTPVVWASLISVCLLAAFFLTRRFAPGGRAAETLGLLWGLAVALLAASLWLGLMRRRLLVGEVLGRLTRSPEQWRRRPGCRRSCAADLDDPTLEVLDPGRPRALARQRRAQPRRRLPVGPGRAATLIPDGNGAAAVALVHGEALRADQELLSAISALVLGTVRHQDATSKLAAAMRQLEQSRRRIAEAGDLERARIERDLHDGAQQRLMMLRIRLSLVEEQTAAGQRRRGRRRPRPGERGRADARRAAVPRARCLPGDPERPRAGGGAAQPGGHHHRPAAPADRRAHPPADRAGDRRLLHLPRGRAERDQARALRIRGVGTSAPEHRRPVDRGPGRRSWLPPPRVRRLPGPRSCTPGCATCVTGSRPWAGG